MLRELAEIPSRYTLRKPVNEYKIIREKIAAQKRDVELSLTGFMARTRLAETRIFHKMDQTKYPMIAPEDLPVTYLRALFTEEECSDELEWQGDQRKDDDSDLKDKNENLKDVQDNPYVKPPKKAKLR
ncbi:transcription initiation factor TFIID subunit 8-like [Rhopilema esculentum]|uniref:transcription initiation factor TFIID subunit 8-like n=1 Tax=Rhopilema esculentum TaxID=499914 RepID=UPI0031D60B28